MKVTDEQLAHLAELAQMSLTTEETRMLGADLTYILDDAELVQASHETAIPPQQAQGGQAALRADVIAPSLAQSVLLGQAPDTDGGRFIVPRTVERQT